MTTNAVAFWLSSFACLLFAAWFTGCELFNSEEPERKYLDISVNRDFDENAFDSVEFYAVPEGSGDTLLLFTWSRAEGDPFPNRIYYGDSLSGKFQVIIKGWKGGSLAYAVGTAIDESKPDSVNASTYLDSLIDAQTQPPPDTPWTLEVIRRWRGYGNQDSLDTNRMQVKKDENLKIPLEPGERYVLESVLVDSRTLTESEGTVKGTPYRMDEDTLRLDSLQYIQKIQIHLLGIRHRLQLVLDPPEGGSLSRTPDSGWTSDGEGESLTVWRGDQIALTPQANSGYRFVWWTVDGRKLEEETLFQTRVESDLVLVAKFVEIDKFLLTVTTQPADTANKVTLDPPGGTYEAGDTVTITPSPADVGYRFSHFFLDEQINNQPSLKILITKDTSVVAVFDTLEYALELTAGENGGGVPEHGNPDSLFKHGRPYAIFARPDSLHTFDRWNVVSGMAELGDTSAENTTITLTGNATVEAAYSPRPLLPNVVMSPPGKQFSGSIEVTLSFDGSAPADAEIRFTTDDTDPTATSEKYDSPLVLSETGKVNARGFAPYPYLPSPDVASQSYGLNAAPVLTFTSPALTRDSVVSNQASLTLTGTAHDDGGPPQLSARVGADDATPQGDTAWTLTASLPQRQWTKIEVTARDTLGASKTVSATAYYRAPLDAPGTPSLDSSGMDFLALSWSNPEFSDSILIYRATAGSAFELVQTVTGESWVNTGLASGTSYRYGLRSKYTAPGTFDLVDTSGYSDTLTAATVKVFQKTFGGDFTSEIRGLAVLTSGPSAYAAAGWDYLGGFGSGKHEFILIQTDENGAASDTKYYGGSQSDTCYALVGLTGGGFLLAGEIETSFGVSSDGFLVKTGPGPQEKTIEKPGRDAFYAAVETSDGGFAAAGLTDSASAVKGFLIKLKPDFNTAWMKSYGSSGEQLVFHDLVETDDGGLLLVGSVGPNLGASEGFALKVDSAGERVWDERYSGASDAYSVVEAGSGNYLIVGSAAGGDAWILRIDGDDGEEIKSTTLGGSGSDRANSIAGLDDGGYIVAGQTSSFGAGSNDCWLIRLDSHADTLWTRTFGGDGDDRCNAALPAADGGFLAGGATTSAGPGGTQSMYLIKTDYRGLSAPFP